MNRHRPTFGRLAAALLLGALACPATTLACATCYGASDAAMARGMNAGIFTLLAIICAVLAGIGGFMIFLAKRSAATPIH